MLKNKLFIGCLFISCLCMAQERPYNYNFFTNSAMAGNHFFSRASASGNSAIKNIDQKLPVSETMFHSPGNALELEFTNGNNGKWQALVSHREIRGQDHFAEPNFLAFNMYVKSPYSHKDDLPLVSFLLKDSTYSKQVSLKTISPGKWQRVTIDMRTIFGKVDLQQLIGISFSQQGNRPGQHTIYIDDIELLEKESYPAITIVPQLLTAKGYARHVDINWKKDSSRAINLVRIYRSVDGHTYKPVGIQYPFNDRYADYTGETGKKYFYKIAYLNNDHEEGILSKAVSASTREMSDDELLSMVQEASFRYYWDGAESSSGLAKENIAGRHDMIASGASGFGIMALITGTERKFITRKESVDRFVKIVNFLEKAETFHGVYPHFINGPTGKVEPFFGKRDNGADLVETSFLLQGLLAARQYFSGNDPKEKMIRDKITAIWNKTEWDWFRQYPNSKFLYWHWSPDQAWVINHNLIGWNETMVTYLLAIASPTHSVPASMYYTGWANQDSTGQQYRSAWGQTKEGSMYTNGNTYFGIKLDVAVSNGGPLFFTHYSYLGYDPHAITDKYTNYFVNNQNIAKINHRYSVQNPKQYKGYSDSAWGLTASDGPFDYSADEPVTRQDRGKIAPTGAISSFPYTPEESMKALKNYYFNYGKFLWGEYGFRDAFDLTNNWCSEIYMGLNQAPMTVMIENYRTGLIWKLFMQDKDVREGLKRLNAETNKK